MICMRACMVFWLSIPVNDPNLLRTQYIWNSSSALLRKMSSGPNPEELWVRISDSWWKNTFCNLSEFYVDLKIPYMSPTQEGGQGNAPSCLLMCFLYHKRCLCYKASIIQQIDGKPHPRSPLHKKLKYLFTVIMIPLYLHFPVTQHIHSPSKSKWLKTTILIVSKLSCFKQAMDLRGN